MGGWKFFTNHAAVLACVANEPAIRVRDIADQVGVTERAANRIVGELEAAGYLTRRRVGARNSYEVHPELPLRHPLADHHSIGELLSLLVDPDLPTARRRFGRDEPSPSPTRAGAAGRPPQPSSMS